MQLKPITIIHSAHKNTEEASYQSPKIEDISQIEIFEAFTKGLLGIEGFSNIIIICRLHQPHGYHLLVKTPWYDNLQGTFTTKSAHSPLIGESSYFKLDQMEGKLGKGRQVTAIGIYTLLAIAVGTGCASGLSEIYCGFIIVPISYWIILALDVHPDITTRAAVETNLLVILLSAIISISGHNKMREMRERKAVILKICNLIRTSLGATLAARQKGDGTICNGEHVVVNLTSVASLPKLLTLSLSNRCLTRLYNQLTQEQIVKWRDQLA